MFTLEECLKRIASLGGKASMAARTKEEKTNFARSGGKAGGVARAKILSPKRKSEIGRKGALAMWAKKRAAEKKKKG